MAYKQNAGRGKSDSYASMISKGLINGDGGDEKSRVVAEGPLTEKNIVEGSSSITTIPCSCSWINWISIICRSTSIVCRYGLWLSGMQVFRRI